MDRYLTTEEIAQQLNVSVETVRRWVHQGKLPGFPVGRVGYRIRQEDFDHFVQRQQQLSSTSSDAPHESHTANPTPSIEALAGGSHSEYGQHMEAIATFILERMTDGVVYFGSDETCQYANESAAQLLGVSPESLLGKKITALPENLSHMREPVQGHMQQGHDFYSTATGRWFQVRSFTALQG